MIDGYIAKDNDGIYSGESLSVSFKDSTVTADNFDTGFIYGFMKNLGIKVSLDITNIYGGKSVKYL